jgi:hypothetical protein
MAAGEYKVGEIKHLAKLPRAEEALATLKKIAWQVNLGGSVALSLCTAAHPLYTRSANIFGASISEVKIRCVWSFRGHL